LIESDIPRLLRLKQIIGDAKAEPPILPIIPISKSSWWAGVKAGLYPEPLKIGPNTTVWREDEVRALVEDLCQMRNSD
jgi:prophage regulatory protein